MNRILVPIDFSDVTPRVIGVTQQLAKALDAEILSAGQRNCCAISLACG